VQHIGFGVVGHVACLRNPVFRKKPDFSCANEKPA
jgi:hypothetical protein